MRHPLLNFDVLALVCESISDTKTVLSFSLVSHALRPMAATRLLSMKPVVLKDERTIRAFHKFLFTDSQSRLPFFRVLDISISEIKKEAFQEISRCILDLLERATHLECLTLPYPGLTLVYSADPRVLDTIIRISTLRELELLDNCDESEMIVKSTRSATSLRTLRASLEFLPISWRSQAFGVKMSEVDTFLQHLIPTLEVLDTRKTPLVLDTKGAEYPAVRSFVGSFVEGVTCTDILVSKFPALDGTLGVGKVNDILGLDLPRQQHIRASNQDRQKQKSWKHLDRVVGDVTALFVLGLTCPVRHLMVDGICGLERLQIADILRSTPTTHLKLSSMLYWHGNGVFEDLFPAEVIPRLTHLVFVIKYMIPCMFDHHSDSDAVSNMNLRVLLTQIIASTCTLRLTHFRLFIHYFRPNAASYVPHSKDFVRRMATLDHAHLATELAHALPSLQYTFVSTGGQCGTSESDDFNKPRHTHCRWFTHSAWKNVPSGPPRRLDTDVMEQMLVDEDLVLSDADNCSLGLQNTWEKEETTPGPFPE